MVRKLAFAVSLALGTLSVPAHALGLGDLSSRSALNQNFQGDIALLSVEPEELDTVRVRLADAEAFSRAGVERPFYLSLLKFEPTVTAKGRTVIRVTSEFPIREPFMNFLIEVNWPNGRLLREYTVLLDPPTTTMRRPSPVTAPTKAAAAPKASAAASSPAPSSAATPAPSVAVSAGATEYGPVKANETAWSIAKKLRPRGVSMEQMMMALLDANPQAFLNGNVNLLRKGQIMRVPAVAEIQQLTRQDARQAYRQQQDEWLARRNQRLQQAAEDDATAQAAAEAEAGSAGQAEASDQLRIATARPEGSGEAGAGDDDAQSPTATDLNSRLMVARENAETTRQEAENLRTRVDELQARLQDMQRLLSLKDEQLAQLQDRVGLEQEVAAVEESATPSADGASADQVEPVPLETPTGPVETTAEITPEPVAVRETVTLPEDYAIADIPPQIDPDRIVAEAVAEVAAEGGVAEGVPGEQPAAQPTVESEAAVSESLTTPTAEGEVVVIEDVTAVTPAQPPVEPTAEAGPSTFEPPAVPTVVTQPPVEPAAATPADVSAKSDSLIPAPLRRMVEQNLLPIAGGGVALLALIGLLVARRRRKPDDQEPVAAVAATTAAAAGTVAEDRVEPEAVAVDRPVIDEETLNDLPDSAFLDELSPADLNALQDETGEVDPVSEADVYIAYGRYQQAEELLRQAMQRDPGRLALTHKLLEVHYATPDADAFVALAQSMVDAGQDKQDAAAWARAQDMGRELAPENPLFAQTAERGTSGLAAAGVAAVAAVAADADAGDEDTLSLDDMELSELEAAYEESGLTSSDLERPSEVSITLDLEDEAGDLAEQQAEAAVSESIALDDLESVDFTLPEVEDAAVAEADLDAEGLGGDTLDLESMMAEAEAAVDQDDSVMNLDSEFSAEELQAQLDELSELSVLAPELDDTPEPRTDDVRGSLGLVAEDRGAVSEGVDEPFNLDSEFSIDEGEAGDEMPEFLAINDSGVPAESVSEDEVSTKLDLARAYFEMGDDDGARSILEEVVAEGNDSQRGDAQQMLAKIG